MWKFLEKSQKQLRFGKYQNWNVKFWWLLENVKILIFFGKSQKIDKILKMPKNFDNFPLILKPRKFFKPDKIKRHKSN